MVTTPLQKAAQAVIDRWDSPAWKDQPHTSEYIAELRKALEAEIAQAVEPVGHFLDCGNPQGWCEVHDDYKDDADVVPLYLHPPQPQATTPVPEDILEAIRLSRHTLVKTQFGYRLNFIGAATAQGENP